MRRFVRSRGVVLRFLAVADFYSAYFHSPLSGGLVPFDVYVRAVFGTGVVSDQLSESGKHNEQSDAAQAKLIGQRPQEDEEPDAQEDVLDAPAAQVELLHTFEKLRRSARRYFAFRFL